MEFLNIIKSKDREKIDIALKDFLDTNAQSFIFTEFCGLQIKKEIWDSLISLLMDKSLQPFHLKCVQVLKILSRDKQHLNNIINEQTIDLLLYQANLNSKEHSQSWKLYQDFEGISEAQKCIFNLIFNNTKCRAMFLDGHITEAIIFRLSEYNENLPHAVKLFDLKILFLLSALCPNWRPNFRYTLKGVYHMIQLLDRFLTDPQKDINDEEAEYCSEALKIIFNLLIVSEKPVVSSSPECHSELFNMNDEDESEQIHCLMHHIHTCLSAPKNVTKMDDVKSHAVNLLTAINSDYYSDLHIQLLKDSRSPKYCIQQTSQSEDVDLRIPEVLLHFLGERLELPDQMMEKLAPILTVIAEYSRKHRIVRKFFKAHILPPLRDVTRRPEEGDTLRNKLCRLMTCAVTHIQTLVAELLFVLCKENVGRLIKYTGYGNAAGLLAHRGLMLGRRVRTQCEHMSDSDDSDTEEYINMEDKINPVTGCLDTPKSNPMEGMTEEQKEYEAVRLLNIMDRLQRGGIIQPARIGEDGKPHAVEHVLQLQEGIGFPNDGKGDTSNNIE